jgi:hypothetical protein
MAKLNVQGLSRRDPGLMSCLLPDQGNVVVSADLSAGEPTITSHFSRDPRYYAATFGMVGKPPYYDGEVLFIDDIYLMVASVSPIGRALMREMFNTKFNGLTFSQQWLVDADVIKTQIKDQRNLHKVLTLGLGYSMGPRKLVKSAYEKGHTLPLKTAKEFFNAYWELFSGVKRLADLLEAKFKRDGYLVNPFGYRLIPDPSYKAFNYFIQSSVSGLMNVLNAKFFALCPYAQFVTVIHDELIAEVPEEKAAEAKSIFYQAVQSLNDDLKWTVDVRCGWVEGKDWYTAK